MAKKSGKYRFRKHDSIGATDADDDESYLNTCFEDNGDLAILMDCSSPKRIILGRTGAGKTALLRELEKRSEHVIRIDPEHLSLNFLTNSTILPYLESLGVNLDPFYKLLWRHVFAVTIIQDRFDIVDERRQGSFIASIREVFESKEVKAKRKQDARRREKALLYIQEWGERFFEDVEYRTKEVAQRFESAVVDGVEKKFGGNAGGKLKSLINLGLNGSRSSSTQSSDNASLELRQEVFDRAQTIVNDIHVQQLGGILELLEELLDDPKKPCYIAIDQLDEPWAENDLRLKLLKGLIDTVREFRKVHNAKLIVCLRIDLLEQIFKATRSEAGFQEDKYRSLNLALRWTNPQLVTLLNRRVSKLAKDAYTSYQPTLADLMPEALKFGKSRVKTIDYILDRTWERPRDAIEFINLCITKSEGKTIISKGAILDAEGEYSRGRLRAISAEWHAQYPNLPNVVKTFLRKRPSSFKLAEVSDEVFEEWSLKIACAEQPESGGFYQLAMQHQAGEIDLAELKREILSMLYKTGCVGLKTSAFTTTRWANSESYSVSPAEIDEQTSVSIHPGLWRVLGVEDFAASPPPV